jgi:TRAP-type mannitol/chloroaromatic compound transport system permease small subunit
VFLSWKYVGQSYAIDEKSPDPGGITMRWLLKSLLPLGYGLLFLQSFGALLKLWFLDKNTEPRPANA